MRGGKRQGSGPKPKKKQDKRTKKIILAVTGEESKEIQRRALLEGKTKSAFIRERVLLE